MGILKMKKNVMSRMSNFGEILHGSVAHQTLD